jgi:hypothetical protein
MCVDCMRKRAAKGARRARILKTYGLTELDYARLLLAQEGACAICRQCRPYNLAIDHCHRTGRIRGLLCKLCNNRLLTSARDDPVILRTAAEYLERFPCDAVLGERVIPTKGTDDQLLAAGPGARRSRNVRR